MFVYFFLPSREIANRKKKRKARTPWKTGSFVRGRACASGVEEKEEKKKQRKKNNAGVASRFVEDEHVRLDLRPNVTVSIRDPLCAVKRAAETPSRAFNFSLVLTPRHQSRDTVVGRWARRMRRPRARRATVGLRGSCSGSRSGLPPPARRSSALFPRARGRSAARERRGRHLRAENDAFQY